MRPRLSIIFLLFCSSLFAQEMAPTRQPVSMVTLNFCPLGCYPEGEEIEVNSTPQFRGIVVDTIRCTFEKMKTPLNIRVYPWTRSLLMARNGEVDGFFPGTSNPTRDATFTRTNMIVDFSWEWYLLKENPQNPENTDFKSNATVAAFLGSNMLFWLESQGYKINAKPIKHEMLLEILLLKRVDAFLGGSFIMRKLIEERGLKSHIKIFTAQHKPIAAYFTKSFLANRPNFLNEFNSLIPTCQ